MKKLILSLPLCCVFFIFSAKAQDTPEKPSNYLSISAGLSSPLGNFRTSDYGTTGGGANNKSGFAKKGVMYDFEGGFYFHKNWGLAISLGYEDQGRLNSNDATNLSNGYRVDYNAYTSTVTASKRYSIFNLMAGPQYNLNLGSKFIVDARVTAGFLRSFSTPDIAVVLDNYEGTQTSTFSQYSSKSWVFAYGGSASFTWKMSEGVGLVLRENYINTPTGFKYKERRTCTAVTYSNQTVTVYQTSLGLRFAL
jgi:opacity protein-like surface antigen